MQKISVLLVFGGESSEHDVSLTSARNVAQAIDGQRYDVLYCYIDRRGVWWLVNGVEQATDTAERLQPELGRASFVTQPSQTIIQPQVMLPILHGKNGEDGSVPALAQLLHIPIVGCDMTASAVGMDKVLSKQLMAHHGLAVTAYLTHRSGEAPLEYQMVARQLGPTVFVKPARAGSSVGVSRAATESELATAIAKAHQHDTVVLIEQAIAPVRELEVAVLGTPPHHRVSEVGEVIPGADFYSYEDKYATDSRSRIEIPAQLDAATTETIQAQASQIFSILGGSGLARIDFFVSNDNQVIFNEINTLPGFTSISMYPQLWQHDGMSYQALVSALLEDALARS